MLVVLISVSHAQDVFIKNAPCENFVDDLNTVTLNCSRRNIDTIPKSWPAAIRNVDSGEHCAAKLWFNIMIIPDKFTKQKQKMHFKKA